jgi:hypothetical protein
MLRNRENMSLRLAHLLQPKSDRDAITEDVRPYVGTSEAERAEIMQRLCESAAEQVATRSDGARVLAFQDRRSVFSMALWQSLVERYRGHR